MRMPKGIRLRQDLGVHHCADGADLHSIKHRALKNLKGTIDITNFYAEEHADESFPTPGINQPMRADPAVWRGSR